MRRARPRTKLPRGRLAGRLLLLAPLVVACANGMVALADEITFELRLEGGRVPATMRVIRVKQGDVVRLRWSSDRPIALHLHGYDIEERVEPGAIAEMRFTARATGRFSVEEHKPAKSGGSAHGEPIVRIEIHPR
jgi:hypothetical protein